MLNVTKRARLWLILLRRSLPVCESVDPSLSLQLQSFETSALPREIMSKHQSTKKQRQAREQQLSAGRWQLAKGEATGVGSQQVEMARTRSLQHARDRLHILVERSVRDLFNHLVQTRHLYTQVGSWYNTRKHMTCALRVAIPLNSS